MCEGERWETGDVVLAADGALWRREVGDFDWSLLITAGAHMRAIDSVPVRPLVLLVRADKPAVAHAPVGCDD
jgi:hypothetical protein